MFVIILFWFSFKLASSTNVQVNLTSPATLSPNGMFKYQVTHGSPNNATAVNITMFDGLQLPLLITSLVFSVYTPTNLYLRFSSTERVNIRVDTKSLVTLDINLNACGSCGGFRGNIRFILQIDSKQLVEVIFGRFYQSRSQLLKLGQLPYYYFSSPERLYLSHEAMANQNTSFSQRIEVIEILRTLCQLSINIRCNQYLTGYSYEVNLGSQSSGKGVLKFSASHQIKDNNCITRTQSIYVKPSLISHNVYQDSNPQQYANFSWNKDNKFESKQFILDYKFQVGPTICSNVKAQSSFIQGLFNTTTNSHDSNKQYEGNSPYNLTQCSLYSTFTLQIRPFTSVTRGEVCIIIILSKKVTSSQLIQIEICLWSNIIDKYKSIDNNPPIFQIAGNTFNFYDKGDEKHFWINKYIYPQDISAKMFDLSKFVLKAGLDINIYQLMAVKHSIRVYCGQIRFQNITSYINITQLQPPLPDTPPSPPAPQPQQQTNLSSHNSPAKPSSNTPLPPYKLSNQVKTTVSTTLGIPNIGLLLRLVQILNLLDDLSYFIYHNTTYDAAFTYVSELSWVWVHAKWTPPEVIQIGVNLSAGFEPGWVPFRQPVRRFAVKGERMAFLDNCKGYLLYTVVSSSVLFVGLWKIYWKIKHYKISAVISSFGSLAYLVISLVCDNGQYLSFRGFEQLRSLGQVNCIIILSQILAIIILFLSVFCSFALFPLSHSLACNLFRPPTLLRRIPSYKYLLISTSCRLLAGYIHVSIDQPLTRISLLVGVQSIVLISTILSWSCTRYKTPHTVLITGQCARLVLYLVVCLEVVFPEVVERDKQGENRISEVSYFLVQVMMLASGLQIVLTGVVGAVVGDRAKRRRDKKVGKKLNGKEETQGRTIIKAKTIRSTTRKLAQANHQNMTDAQVSLKQTKPIQEPSVNIEDKKLRVIVKAKTIIRKERKQPDEKNVFDRQQKRTNKTVNIPPPRNLDIAQSKPRAFMEGDELYIAKKYQQKMMIKKMKQKQKWKNKKGNKPKLEKEERGDDEKEPEVF